MFKALLVALAAFAQSVMEGPAPLAVLALQSQTAHVQGIDTDGTRLWVTSVDRANRKGFLQEFSLPEGRLRRTFELQNGDRFHPGGISADADALWIPVAEYRRASTALIQRRNKKSFALEFEFEVSDHIGCLAVTPEFLIGGNWDSRDFYVWNHQCKLLRKVTNTTGNGYQDIKVHNGQLVASGLLAAPVDGRRAAIDWLDLNSFAHLRRVVLGDTDRKQPFTREGMTIHGSRLWLLPEDRESRLFQFDLSKLVAGI